MFSPFKLSAAATACALLIGAQAQAQPKSAPKSRPVVATGFVAGAPGATEFQLRTRAGLYRVQFHSKVSMKGIRGGDRVRVFGRPLGRTLHDANVRLLETRASDNPDDYAPPATETLDGTPRRGAQPNSGAR